MEKDARVTFFVCRDALLIQFSACRSRNGAIEAFFTDIIVHGLGISLL